MEVSPSAEVEAIVPAGFMKEMATIIPRPAEAWSYSYNVSITQLLTKAHAPTSTPAAHSSSGVNGTTSTPSSGTGNPALSNAEIILYAKPGCGRCSFVRKKMDALNIQYLEIDTHSDSPEVNNMWAQMRSQGFPGGTVTMPVVRVNGKFHWDIKDLESFVNNLR
jgi:glutaredoxin